MTFSLLSVFLLMTWAYFPLVLAEHYDCDKYCFKSCNEYFPGYQFSECVNANIYCSCETEVSTNNPFMVFLIVGVIILAIFICGVCCRCIRNNDARSDFTRTIAYPQQVTVVSSLAGENNRTNYGNGSTTDGNLFVNNPSAPLTNYVPPAEYLDPPPPYNECVKDTIVPSETDRLLK